MRWTPLPPSPGGTLQSGSPGPPPSWLPAPQPEIRIAGAIAARARESARARGRARARGCVAASCSSPDGRHSMYPRQIGDADGHGSAPPGSSRSLRRPAGQWDRAAERLRQMMARRWSDRARTGPAGDLVVDSRDRGSTWGARQTSTRLAEGDREQDGVGRRDRDYDWPGLAPHIPRGVHAGRVVIRRARLRHPSAQQPPASSRVGVLPARRDGRSRRRGEFPAQRGAIAERVVSLRGSGRARGASTRRPGPFRGTSPAS
jgi:hypothetical protein